MALSASGPCKGVSGAVGWQVPGVTKGQGPDSCAAHPCRCAPAAVPLEEEAEAAGAAGLPEKVEVRGRAWRGHGWSCEARTAWGRGWLAGGSLTA